MLRTCAFSLYYGSVSMNSLFEKRVKFGQPKLRRLGIRLNG